MENEMYRQALLEAKAIRASAIANAKASLQEAFEPKIQEMLRLKLSEELEEELEEDVEEALKNEEYSEESVQTEENSQELEEAELEEILKELESLSEESEEVEEAKDYSKHDVKEEGLEENYEDGIEETIDEEEEEEEEEEEDGEEGGEEAGEELENVTDETEVVELTVGDLKKVLQDLMAAGEISADSMGGEETEEMPGEEDDTLSLDEILAELEEGEEEIEEVKKKDEKPMKKEGKGAISGNGFGKGSKEASKTGATNWKTVGHVNEAKKQLAEANKTIKALSEKMNEINLLNAKLLYMNKIFKTKALSESEKMKVVNAFDRTNSVKEVKNTYKTLSESFSSKKSHIKESMGFASKPAGVAPKNTIVDTDPIATRWQQLVFGNK